MLREEHKNEGGGGPTFRARKGHVKAALPPSPDEGLGGHPSIARQGHGRHAASPSPKPSGRGRSAGAVKAVKHVPHSDGPLSLTEGQPRYATKATRPVPDVSETIDAIRAWHRKRMFVMETRKRADLALGSSLRTWLGWRRDNDKDVNDRIKDLASKLIDCGEKVAKDKPHELSDTEEWKEYGDIILAAVMSRAPSDALEKQATKEMERLAVLLPVWEAFGKDVRGFGPRSLAVIIGEAGDLSAYDTHSKLWKRMGLAVMDGIRQGGLPKNAAKDDWIAHGYNKKRRSQMFVIGDVLVKQGEHYRQVYLERKFYERSVAVSNGLIVAPAAKIPDKRKDEFISDGHIHRRAQRYMEKRLLRDLWKAWRRAVAGVLDGARENLPAAELPRNAKEKAA